MSARSGSQRAVNDALAGLPLHDRLAALIVSIIADDPRAMNSVANLIAVATLMAKHLPAAEQTGVAWYLREAAAELETKWQ